MLELRSRLSLAAAMLTALLFAFTSPEAHAMKIQAVKSPGGIEAWLVEEHSVPLIALRFAFNGGNAQDPDGKEGLANFLTGMLDEGAGDLNAVTFQQRMEDIAMRMSFEDGRDEIYGSLETLSANRDKAVELLRLAVVKPRFDADAVERVRAQLIASLDFADKNPDQVAGKAFARMMFPNHPYGRPANGTQQSVAKITGEDLHAYRNRVFARDNLKVVAVGDIDGKALGSLLDTVFGELPAKAQLTPVPKVDAVANGNLKVVEMNVPQSVATFGLNGLLRKDPDFMPAFVLNQILGGGGFASRLMEEVREKRGLSYGIGAQIVPFGARSTLVLGASSTENARVPETLSVLRAVWAEFAKEGPTAEELDDAKAYLAGSFPLSFTSTPEIARSLVSLQLTNRPPDWLDGRLARLAAVDLDRARATARRLYDPATLSIAVAGDPAGL